ncbi:hypothetical protein ABW21_db0201223 [Orbilia brochopaga]|nr:hypothetical protein ABW21_db0201223 [Drechslerella brochopaga]
MASNLESAVPTAQTLNSRSASGESDLNALVTRLLNAPVNAHPTLQSDACDPEATPPGLAKLRDPFQVLPDNVVRDIILRLPAFDIINLRRVSKFWMATAQFVVSESLVKRKFGVLELSKMLKKEGKLGWAELAYRKNWFFEYSKRTGAPTSVKKFTNAKIWEKVGDRLLWIDESSNLNVQHLSAWDINERRESLLALAENPAAMTRNRTLHLSVIEQRRRTQERPERAPKKISEGIVIRWPLRKALKIRDAKLKLEDCVLFACGSDHVILDYVLSPGRVSSLFNTPEDPRRRRLACVNIVTGYTDWDVDTTNYASVLPLDDIRVRRDPYNMKQPCYLVDDDRVYAFTCPQIRIQSSVLMFFNSPEKRRVFLTARNRRTGAVVRSKEIEGFLNALDYNYHSSFGNQLLGLINPDGKSIVLCINSTLFVCNTETCQLVQRVELTFLWNATVPYPSSIYLDEARSRLCVWCDSEGRDFDVFELDPNDRFKVVFIRSYHLPTTETNPNTVPRYTPASFNDHTQYQIRTSINPNRPGECQPEILGFTVLNEVMEGVPFHEWGDTWKSKLAFGHQEWDWIGPNKSFLDQGVPPELLQQLSQLLYAQQFSYESGGSFPHHETKGLTNYQVFGTGDNRVLTPRARVLITTPRLDFVMTYRNFITLPPLETVQPNAIQDYNDDPDIELRSGGAVYTGPAYPKEKGHRTHKPKMEEGKRRDWFISSYPQWDQIINGERFIMFGQRQTVYCCDFGPVGW